ncbi:MAG: efflux RND transporter periplasmic adaptor subunit [Spirochaetaceae bacterium]|nr:MAG: efflux RND transporter periplasmic adaptor subunit [Spirochaetaceae bacterium]
MAEYGMRITRIIAVVMLAALVLACGNRNGADGDDSGDRGVSGAERTTFAVNVTTAVAGSITDYIRVTGDVHPVSSVDIFPDIAGELKRVHVRVGERVQQDQLIAEVDRSRPGQTFAPSPVRSTISGTVTALPVQAGSMVGTGTPVARVAQTDDLEIRTAVAERFVSKMRPGMPATVRLDAYPGEQFGARVTEISPVLDAQTRTLGAKLTLNRRDTRVRPGMFAQIQLITQQKEGVVKIPADTVVRRFGETYIFVVQADESTVERRRVRVGIEIDNVAEIVDGLQPGESIVYQGQSLLEDGARIRVIDRVNVLD